MVSTREDTDYSENNKLDLYLDREEVWGEKWEKNEENIKKDLEILRKVELTLGQSYELYNLLGGDENKALEDIKVKAEDEKEEEEKNDDDYNEDDEIIRRKPNKNIRIKTKY